MTVGFRVDTATSPPLSTLLDAEEVITESATQSTATLRARRGSIGLNGTVNIWGVQSIGFPQGANRDGYLWRSVSTGAIQTGVYAIANSFNTGLGFDHPMGADATTDPPGYVRPVRWTLGCVMRRNLTPANKPSTFGVVAILQALGFTTEPGFEISSQVEVNAGRWTVRRRIIPAGAILSVDTGIPGLTDVYAEIIYDHTTDPTLFARVNGQEFGQVQGLVNVPRRVDRFGNQVAWNICNVSGSPASAGGGNDFYRGFRIIIEELPGFV